MFEWAGTWFHSRSRRAQSWRAVGGLHAREGTGDRAWVRGVKTKQAVVFDGDLDFDDSTDEDDGDEQETNLPASSPLSAALRPRRSRQLA